MLKSRRADISDVEVVLILHYASSGTIEGTRELQEIARWRN